MKKVIFLAILIIIVLIVIVIVWKNIFIEKPLSVTNFEECLDLGYPILESYPRQCKAPNGTFTEDIGNALEKQNLIRVSKPQPNEVIKSPFEITGEARGYWFFEASFPIKLTDENGKELDRTIAQAKSDWMTEDFVPFETTLEFQKPETNRGVLILEKDNPSDLPENADELRIPVRFSK
jgi:hypothetical protein